MTEQEKQALRKLEEEIICTVLSQIGASGNGKAEIGKWSSIFVALIAPF